MSSDRQKTLEQTAFEQVAKLSDVGAVGEKSVDQAFRPLLNQFNQSGKYGHSAAEMARLQQQELRARGIIFAVAVTVIALLIWAAFASLEQIARGQGRVIPSQRLQVIQSQDGGVVEQIHTRR